MDPSPRVARAPVPAPASLADPRTVVVSPIRSGRRVHIEPCNGQIASLTRFSRSVTCRLSERALNSASARLALYTHHSGMAADRSNPLHHNSIEPPTHAAVRHRRSLSVRAMETATLPQPPQSSALTEAPDVQLRVPAASAARPGAVLKHKRLQSAPVSVPVRSYPDPDVRRLVQGSTRRPALVLRRRDEQLRFRQFVFAKLRSRLDFRSAFTSSET